MLNFTKIKIISIYLIFIFFTFFALLNIVSDDKFFIQKKVNLGLDLQGGSYLLLEIDTRSLIQERLQDKVIEIKKLLKKNNFAFNSFEIKPNSINFKMDSKNKDKFE